MNRITGKIRFALAAVFAIAALSAWGITITLNDGTNSAVCTAGSGATIGANGDIIASVAASTSCALGGGGGGGTGPWTLTVTKSGAGAGSVSSNPAGITNCATTCNAPFDNNTNVTLTASVGASSAFGSWAGCTSSNGLTCTVTMTAAKTVTATFNSTGGGGGDPGAGTNPWVNGSNYVHNRGALTDIYVPRCVPNQYTNCRLGGQQSQYDTLGVGQVWSMRLPFAQSSSTSTYSFSLARSETGESLIVYDVAISAVVGDFGTSIPTACKKFNASEAVLKVHDSVALPNPPSWLGSCPLNRNTMYYINVRPAVGTTSETQCGTASSKACRYKIILPDVPTGFYSN